MQEADSVLSTPRNDSSLSRRSLLAVAPAARRRFTPKIVGGQA
jgi:hypothetical protein